MIVVVSDRWCWWLLLLMVIVVLVNIDTLFDGVVGIYYNYTPYPIQFAWWTLLIIPLTWLLYSPPVVYYCVVGWYCDDTPECYCWPITMTLPPTLWWYYSHCWLLLMTSDLLLLMVTMTLWWYSRHYWHYCWHYRHYNSIVVNWWWRDIITHPVITHYCAVEWKNRNIIVVVNYLIRWEGYIIDDHLTIEDEGRQAEKRLHGNGDDDSDMRIPRWRVDLLTQHWLPIV